MPKLNKGNFPSYIQSESKDCGPTSLKIVAKYYGVNVNMNKLREVCETTREGSSIAGLCKGAEFLGFRPVAARTDIETFEVEDILPCIVHWNENHFVVVYRVTKDWVFLSDPAFGRIKFTKTEFVQHWANQPISENYRQQEGILILLYPTPKLGKDSNENSTINVGSSFGRFWGYALMHRHFLFQLALGLLVGLLLQAILPFLTQSVVDIGIQNQDIGFIYLILFCQFFIFIGSYTVDIIRGWIVLHLSTRINISLVADFFIKLMKLPISYFDVRVTGDILQRISDHHRIERLITSDSLSILFSFFTLIVFSIILGFYNLTLLIISIVGNALYLVWILFFLKKRKEIDYKNFQVQSANNSKIIEVINGMQEIKLHNAERSKRWEWEFIQARMFKVSISGLTLSQVQGTGSSFINRIKDILISFIAAKLVIDGNITLGMMLSVTYITGQVNAPISRLINFINTYQDAKISLDRINEIYDKEEEDANIDGTFIEAANVGGDIYLDNVSFHYPGRNVKVLDQINLVIPQDKITAIVGISGSGKTTLMKLLLKYYSTAEGSLKISNQNLNDIPSYLWREKCGVVMQEGYIFNDTISGNISLGDEKKDLQRIKEAITLVNLDEYVKGLPLGLNTKIGQEGVNMSTGQKQRILIARAIYKNPQYLFFDEATSALDANNEKTIIENLNRFMGGKTAVIIAHRLSTVKNADQIVVLDKGHIAETGTHEELSKQKGIYYDLVKNQFELGL